MRISWLDVYVAGELFHAISHTAHFIGLSFDSFPTLGAAVETFIVTNSSIVGLSGAEISIFADDTNGAGTIFHLGFVSDIISGAIGVAWFHTIISIDGLLDGICVSKITSITAAAASRT